MTKCLANHPVHHLIKPRVLSTLCSLCIRNEVDLVPLTCEDAGPLEDDIQCLMSYSDDVYYSSKQNQVESGLIDLFLHFDLNK